MFQLERNNDDAKKVGLPTGLHVLLGLEIDGQLVVRPYTPVWPCSKEEDNGTLEFVIRMYPKGKLTPHLDALKVRPTSPFGFLNVAEVGDSVAMRGPMGSVVYVGRGVFTVHNSSRLTEKVSMVAGGTGIAPLYQVMRSAILDPDDKTKFYLLYANRSADQILLHKELEELAKKAPDRYDDEVFAL